MESKDKTESTSCTKDKTEQDKPEGQDNAKLLNANTEKADIVAKIGEDKSHLPIDRGWAWVVLAACAVQIAIYGGIAMSFGVLFLQFQDRFNSGASEIAIMNLIQNVCLSVSSLLVMTIGLQKFNWRTSVLIGAVLLSSGYFLTAFVTHLWVFYITFGVLTGVGHAFTFPPIVAAIGAYFERHRGLANSIFASGGSVGGLVIAPLVVMLFDLYGYTGAMLIMCGLLLNTFVVGALLRPMEFYEKRKVSRKASNLIVATDHDGQASDNDHNKIRNKPNIEDYGKEINRTDKEQLSPLLLSDSVAAPNGKQHDQATSRARALSEGEIREYESKERNVNIEQNVDDPSNSNKLLDVLSKSQPTLYASVDGICGSSVILHGVDDAKGHLPSNKTDVQNYEKANASGCCVSIKTTAVYVLNTLFDKEVFKKTSFLVFLPMAFCSMSCLAILLTFIPTHASDIGLTNKQIGDLLAMQAVIDFVSKIGMAIVADKGWLRRSTILAISIIVIGTACHLIRYVNDFKTTVALQVISGVFSGQYMSMFAVFLMEVIGADLFKKSLGFASVVHGAAIAVGFPIGGLLRDATGRYIATFHLLGAFGYMAGILVLVLAYMQKRSRQNK